MNWIVAFVLTAVGYALAGQAGLLLAIPPGYASPLYPAAGIAIASVLVFGKRMLPAIALGAFTVNLSLATRNQPLGAAVLVMPLLIAFGAALQAQVGAVLVRRFVSQPLSLTEPRDIGLFLGVGIVSSLVNSSIANLAMMVSGTLAGLELLFSFATWWIGDLLGVLIAAPVVLTLIGRPREAWAPRRRSVGVTLTLVTVLLAFGIHQIIAWNNERVRNAFNHDASGAAHALDARLREPLAALEAMHSVFIGSDEVSAAEMRLASRAWVTTGGLQSLAWSDRVARERVAEFEATARAQGRAGYKVFDRPEGAAQARDDAEVVAVRYIEPVAGNAPALGLNLLSIPAVRAAVDEARRSGQPAATAGFRLTQQAAGEPQVGVALYRALYQPSEPAAEQRAASLRGLVSVTMRMDDQLNALAAQLPANLRVCLVDVTTGAPAMRLAGAADCERDAPTATPLRQVHALTFGGRAWELRISAPRGVISVANGADVWLFALVGLLSTAMLGGFLLTVTGRTHRIETAVRERTAALQAEVHERELADAALRESEQRFRNILNHVPIGVIYTDLRGNVKQANPRFCELTGYSHDELLTLGMADYTHADDLTQDVELMAQLVRGDIPVFRRHKRYVTKRGAIVWVQATVSLLRYADGKPRSIVGVVEDITEHLKLEEAERAREAAEASNHAKSEFLSRMSHELRTPLNAMLGFAQLLELDVNTPLQPEQRPWVGQIQEAGWHLLEMINDVLDLSRIESGNLRLQTETLNLGELLGTTLSLVEGEARAREIRITTELGAGSETVRGDATRVKQILTNLLSNAVKYNTTAGRVHVTAKPVGRDTVEIAVTDSGLGLTPEQLGELFQPFNRLGRERSAQQGTGIGLVISQRLAELMGGSLRVHSVAGEGSSFVLTLPCSGERNTARAALGARAPAQAGYHRRLVHYVEDNETNVEVMRGILMQRPQIELQVSICGLDGLAAIRAQPPDLILLDMHLPDISGMELLRHLRADPLCAAIPIVIVSADALAQQIDAAFEAGCTHYLTKPVSVAELLKVVDDELDRIETRFG